MAIMALQQQLPATHGFRTQQPLPQHGFGGSKKPPSHNRPVGPSNDEGPNGNMRKFLPGG